MKRARRARQRRKNKKKNKRTRVKLRIPVAKPGWAHKCPKDYDRKRDKKVPDDD